MTLDNQSTFFILFYISLSQKSQDKAQMSFVQQFAVMKCQKIIINSISSIPEEYTDAEKCQF